jgi:hypothetical protein
MGGPLGRLAAIVLVGGCATSPASPPRAGVAPASGRHGAVTGVRLEFGLPTQAPPIARARSPANAA